MKHAPARFSEIGHDERVGTQHGPEAGPGATTAALMGRAAWVSAGTEEGPSRGEHHLQSLQQDPAGVEVALEKKGVYDARVCMMQGTMEGIWGKEVCLVYAR